MLEDAELDANLLFHIYGIEISPLIGNREGEPESEK
jgi:hypothetical protein